MLDHTKDTSLLTSEQQDETVNDLLALGARLQYSPSHVQQIRRELGQFMEAKSKWGGAKKRNYYADPSITWWTWIEVKIYPLLSTIAQSVFTVPSSSAAAKRSWSIFKYIHSTHRNRLTNENVIKLVFIYSNHGPKAATSEVDAATVSELNP
ncbi:unnamed protein product [Phytophthora fragariaefolia]|uniref:Unnamed protein product n=1 Tax=Phytophthora fragariaefolia TaxID=1490495 RepID=A0A9W6XSC7_9STRA|nr:unnamed protein product [Phytophthora fragariaefolia]